MKPYPTTDCRASRSGFTLIELLVVITLIALLGSMSIAVSRVAIESAKKSRTEMTIAKIDAALTTMYEKYADRKVDVSPYLSRAYSNNGNVWFYDNCSYVANDLWNYYGTNTTAQFYMADTSKWTGTAGPAYLRNNRFLTPALWRLHLIRDMMRMDMPCWATEVYWGPVLPNGALDPRVGRTTPLSAIYQGALSTATGNNWDAIFTWTDAQHAQFNAELLFLVIMNGDPEARQLFGDRE
ncbi:MAG: type II secretion system protein, partial [Planctomycetia bacterium]|nr:type II secretion system protein [Planctomycetia bacterium]